MEDGAFLGRTLGAVVQGKISVAEAIHIYEVTRMPKAYYKQQVSFLNGEIWHLPDGELQEVRMLADWLTEQRFRSLFKLVSFEGGCEIRMIEY